MWIREVLEQTGKGVFDMTKAYLGSKPDPIGYCCGWRELTAEELGDPEYARILNDALDRCRPFQGKYHFGGHPTKEAAIECYKRYLIDQRVHWRRAEDEVYECQEEGCKAVTEAQWTFEGKTYALCDAHRNETSLLRILKIPFRHISRDDNE